MPVKDIGRTITDQNSRTLRRKNRRPIGKKSPKPVNDNLRYSRLSEPWISIELGDGDYENVNGWHIYFSHIFAQNQSPKIATFTRPTQQGPWFTRVY